MRIRRTIATTLITAAAVAALGTPASATFVLPDTSGDLCKNVKGAQDLWDIKGGTYRFKFRTPASWDCVKPRG